MWVDQTGSLISLVPSLPSCDHFPTLAPPVKCNPATLRLNYRAIHPDAGGLNYYNN